MKKKLRVLLAVGIVLTVIPSCLKSNAEGYTGRVSSSPKYFYRYDPGYKCQLPTTGEWVESYAQAIEVRLDSQEAKLLGDRCSTTQTQVSFLDLSFSEGFNSVIYQDQVFSSGPAPDEIQAEEEKLETNIDGEHECDEAAAEEESGDDGEDEEEND